MIIDFTKDSEYVRLYGKALGIVPQESEEEEMEKEEDEKVRHSPLAPMSPFGDG